jgi:hypothetical protein
VHRRRRSPRLLSNMDQTGENRLRTLRYEVIARAPICLPDGARVPGIGTGQQ